MFILYDKKMIIYYCLSYNSITTVEDNKTDPCSSYKKKQTSTYPPFGLALASYMSAMVDYMAQDS